MDTKRLDRPEWPSAFAGLANELAGQQAFIEISSDTLGHQTEANWSPLRSLSYDPKDDLFEIGVGGLDHMVRQPTDVYLASDAGRLASLEIVDAERTKHIVRLREPVALAAPERRSQ